VYDFFEYFPMKAFNLSKSELEALRAAHKLEKNKHAAYKINAVILLGSGWTGP
jgi:hypothetical protein